MDELDKYVKDEERILAICLQKTAKDFGISEEECEQIIKNSKRSKIYKTLSLINRDIRHNVDHFPTNHIEMLEKVRNKKVNKIKVINYLKNFEHENDNGESDNQKALKTLRKFSRTIFIDDYKDYPEFLNVFLTLFAQAVISHYDALRVKHNNIVIDKDDDDDESEKFKNKFIYTDNPNDIEIVLINAETEEEDAIFEPHNYIDGADELLNDKTVNFFTSLFKNNDYINFNSMEIYNIPEKDGYPRGRKIGEHKIPVLKKIKMNGSYSYSEIANILFKMRHNKLDTYYEGDPVMIYMPKKNAKSKTLEDLEENINELISYEDDIDTSVPLDIDFDLEIQYPKSSKNEMHKYVGNIVLQYIWSS